MKFVLALMLAAPVVVFAGGKNPEPTPNPLINNTAVGVGVGNGGSATGGSSDSSVSNRLIAFPTASSALAPNVVSNLICPMVVQRSKAHSNWIFSTSETTTPDIVAICVAWHLGQKDVVERLACKISPEYRDANVDCVGDD